MNTQCVIIACFLLFSATFIQGFAIPRGNRCLCKRLSNSLNVMAVEKLEIYPRSSTCQNKEYIATIKNSRKCVRPDLREVKALLAGNNRHLKHIPVIHY